MKTEFLNNSSSNLTDSQKKELDSRLAKHRARKPKYYTMNEIKKSVWQALRK